MFDWTIELYHALVFGLLLTVAVTGLSAIVGAVALDVFVGDYPPDIRQKYGPISPRAARLRPYVAVVLFTTTLVVPILGLFALHARSDSVSFLTALVYTGIALLVFNIIDLMIIDWLFFCTIQPRSMVLPGTEGMAGYRDYGFHFTGFLKGLGFTLVISLLVAVLWIILQ